MMERREETTAVKRALKAAGIQARVTHGKGTGWGWIEVNIGDPADRNGLEPHPRGTGTQYTEEERTLQEKTLRIIQEITGRDGEYHGRILVQAQTF
jgi:hypothetical protein